ncbi:2,3-dihydroxybenzoate-AMP ligase [Falsiruegeria litorea R37]|uniref:3-methylmercaptopropionyl-CoA ligase n=1 Tax=Falsiruegeria litorea R37 TaxID=1200284 RepID=A0A1Y5TWZ7_9RHOB|nr:AMP-binding protein [Falsiruegeria litorea]SLN72487.1 2,3-dihydroxybenzoate-AMP ligase [Falsiruegeria litorea R37]
MAATHSRAEFPIQDDEQIIEQTVGALLREVAAEVPDRLCLIEVHDDGSRGSTWTFAQMLSDAERLAHALLSRFEPGEKICVWAPNVPEWIILEFACALSGLVLVTANPAYQVGELNYVLKQSGSVALFLTESYRGNPMAKIAQQAVGGLEGIREITNIQDHAALYHQASPTSGLPEVDPMSAAQIQYTSGTTGFPKGAMLHHLGLTNNARFYAQALDVEPGSHWATYMPLFHTSGCAMSLLGALANRSPLFVVKLFDPGPILEMLEREKVVWTGGVPTMFVAMLEVMKVRNFDLNSLQVVSSGGSMVAPELVRTVKEVFGCEFVTVYGQTECSPLVTMTRRSDTIEDTCTTIGRPLPQTEVSIRSVSKGTVKALGETGEICVRGYAKMLGYHDNPEATASTIDAEGWLHTGDLGHLDERGYVTINGRVKEMIIRGGENLFPAEIENTLLEHEAVADVAVVGLPDDKWGEIVAAFIRPAEGAVLNGDSLKAHCRERLAAIKTPVVWASVDSFPLTGSGKIQKFALRENYLKGEIQSLP